jgi:hypothetical protein
VIGDSDLYDTRFFLIEGFGTSLFVGPTEWEFNLVPTVSKVLRSFAPYSMLVDILRSR